MTDNITYRDRGYAPQTVFLNGEKVGHVEYEGDGWGAFWTDGQRLGFSEHKSGAGKILVAYSRGGSGSL